MTSAVLPGPRPILQVGRTFLHPVWDYLLIAALPSLPLTALLLWGGHFSETRALAYSSTAFLLLPITLLVCNASHFAASTVRLYTRPDAFREFRFLTLALPLLTLALVTLAIGFAPYLGFHMQALYLTWSPFHYAAQAYGLALMYCYRSGCALAEVDRRLLRAACLAPFLYALANSAGTGAGLDWVLPGALTTERAQFVLVPLGVASFALPALWLWGLGRKRSSVPLISLLIVLVNAIWFTTLSYLGAFVWATVFHSVQYLVIVTIFHVKDRLARPGNVRGWLAHALGFYAACLALGFALFEVWPLAYVRLGFGLAESMILVGAMINIHHFVVDAYIWRLRQGTNRVLVAAPAAA